MPFARIAAAALAVAVAATAASAATTTKKTTTTTTKTTTVEATGPAAAGRKVFTAQCGICHSAEPGDKGVVGPPLNGVVGRKVATAPGFTYSKAMKSKSHTWSKAILDVYLTDPQKFVPGTTMPIMVPSAKDRADVIAYLATTK